MTTHQHNLSGGRSAGILLHISSLPSRFGIGDLGSAAFECVDFLSRAGQCVWQILPLCPTGAGNSPYSSYSAFAGNVMLLSPESMVEKNWLSAAALTELFQKHQPRLSASDISVDFGAAAEFKRDVLLQSFHESHEKLANDDEFLAFCQKESWWLDNFAHFEALRDHLGESNWTKWPEPFRDPVGVMSTLPTQLSQEILFSKFKQFQFESQWRKLKSYANTAGVRICGDMPIFVAHQSADVWANQNQFLLDEAGQPTSVAGVPPDYFSETGQLWGNPLYDWERMESDGFKWWCDRFRRALEQYDLLRVDHFRGFDKFWKIPSDAETAAEGNWENGPGEKPFRAAEAALGSLPIWAEDLGDIDQGVHDLRDNLGFPTMRVLQFGYASEHDDFHRHTTFVENCIAYTGTHDNDTLMGWVHSRVSEVQESGHDALAPFLEDGPDQEPIHFQMINLLYQSAAKVAIVPMQDALGLGNEARMNVPGEAEGNWDWRVLADAFTDDLAKQLRIMVVVSNRSASADASITK